MPAEKSTADRAAGSPAGIRIPEQGFADEDLNAEMGEGVGHGGSSGVQGQAA
ncbi:MAG: hypothetical protein ACTFAK_12420 [Candidatus Electronema sp. VV]